MVAIKAVAHFSIPVSDVPKSTQFYTEVVGCRHLSTTPNGHMVFLDAAGTCLILVKRDPPINPVPDDHGGVHHAFAIAHDEYTAALDHLRAHGIQMAPSTYSAARRLGGVSCGLDHSGNAADFGPDPECLRPGGSVLGGSGVIAAAEVEEIINLIVG